MRELLSKKAFIWLAIPLFGGITLLITSALKMHRRKIPYNVVLSTYFAAGLTFGFGFCVFELAFLFAIKYLLTAIGVEGPYYAVIGCVLAGWAANALFVPVYRKQILSKYTAARLEMQDDSNEIK